MLRILTTEYAFHQVRSEQFPKEPSQGFAMIGRAVRHRSSVAVIRRERSKPTANAGPAPGGGHKVGKGTMILLPSHSPGVCRDHAMRAARREPRRGESPMSAEEQVCRLMNFPGNRGSLSGVSGTNRENMNERNGSRGRSSAPLYIPGIRRMRV